MEASDRIRQAFEYLRFKKIVGTHEDIANKMGANRANVSAAINGSPRYLTKPFLRRFANTYSAYINEGWLLTGDGKMEKEETRHVRPHIPSGVVTVAAGFAGTSIGSVAEEDCDMLPVIPYLPDYDFVITVKGDSMEPMLLNNDKIACAWMEPTDELRPDKIYVVDSREGPVVKKIAREMGSIVCHSLNPRYEDYTISENDVLKLARVVGVVREL